MRSWSADDGASGPEIREAISPWPSRSSAGLRSRSPEVRPKSARRAVPGRPEVRRPRNRILLEEEVTAPPNLKSGRLRLGSAAVAHRVITDPTGPRGGGLERREHGRGHPPDGDCSECYSAAP